MAQLGEMDLEVFSSKATLLCSHMGPPGTYPKLSPSLHRCLLGRRRCRNAYIELSLWEPKSVAMDIRESQFYEIVAHYSNIRGIVPG